MAKEIIILGASADSIMLNVNALFWFSITSGAQPQANGSAWGGASALENQAIQNGAVLEEQKTFSFPTGLVPTAIKAFLVQYWNNRNAELGGQGPALFGGVNFDSTAGWSV